MKLIACSPILLSIVFLLNMLFTNTAYAGLISDISPEKISERFTSGRYGWNSNYDISFINQDLIVDVDVYLAGANASTALLNTWKTGIKSIWGDSFDIFDGTYFYDIVFNIDWVTQYSSNDFDYVLNVHEGSGRANMTNWYNNSNWTEWYHRRVAAHEFGHMVGIYDEYAGGAVDPQTGLTRNDSIMGGGTKPYVDHYDRFVSWLGVNTGIATLSVVAGVGDNHYFISAIPEPSSIPMFVLGIIMVVVYAGFSRLYVTRSKPLMGLTLRIRI
ncbi:hypothetical protein [Flocculibacter collagenilyticus]|uniref:hypothetical protein n=1 Tax=Flocculibacter collagenilyticus TaxID=2744479 RepID=UPI0018F3FC9C|nr:hypothetical protein [Flocculibacter collagenilyticus]